jgi:hypothetical protein
MKRLITRVTVAMLTFSIGAASELLHTPRQFVFAEIEARKFSAANESALTAQVSAGQSTTELVCNYDPREFNPRGDYYILGRKPKHFREFDCLELAVDHSAPEGVAVIQTYSNGVANSYYAVSGSLSKRHLKIVALAVSDVDFDYGFDGNFLKRGVLSEAGRNEPVLRGTLVKSKQGVKIAECEVTFRIEYLGC